MSRQLSAPILTLIFRMGFLFWVAGSLLVVDVEWVRATPASAVLGLLWLLATYLAWLSWGRLARVSLEGELIVVSNYFRTWRAPIAEIEEVLEPNWSPWSWDVWRPERILIRFRGPYRFGAVVLFVPRQDLDFVGRPHPFVVELRALAGLKEVNAR